MTLIACTMLSGCGPMTTKPTRFKEFSAMKIVENVETEEDKEDEEDVLAQADYVMDVEGVDVGINFQEGYKPYVIVFRTNDDKIMPCDAYLKTTGKDVKSYSMEEAKEIGMIYDYWIDYNNGILVFDVKETEKLELWPLPTNYEVRLGDVETYNFLWCDAAMDKIGIGGTYYIVDIIPEEEFKEVDICPKKVFCESYQYKPLGSDVYCTFMFVNGSQRTGYKESNRNK